MLTTRRVASGVLVTAVTTGLLAMGTVTATGQLTGRAAAAAAPAKSGPVAVQGTVTVLKGQPSLPGMKSLKGRDAAKRIALKGYSMDSEWSNAMAWGANVRVHSGRYGAVTDCSDGSRRLGPLQGPGYWAFGGNCQGAGHLTGYGVYGRG